MYTGAHLWEDVLSSGVAYCCNKTLSYKCGLKKKKTREAWHEAVHGIAKKSDMTERLNLTEYLGKEGNTVSHSKI